MTLWVFAYGSLLWNPGFPVVEAVPASLDGWHRSFCMRSIHHRGTVENPGLVLALDEDAAAVCHGMALGAPAASAEDTIAYLRERELISSAYVERYLPLTLADGRRVDAVTYVIDTDHDQYCRSLPLEEQARIIARAVGGRGPNAEYLHNTVTHLVQMGIEDADLQWLDRQVRLLCR
ncbi:gamma-glutamylcyclotransferase [Mesobacterium sp. TK19101]|uniref:glutathione-specific gamma-glutamylcyclotransferase n=1 Tax=Mesobacterium hydrothermale TaxID=3111907 RepID=A0ABU6HJY2_9RHOB|nr:gamma-glutamylcyclotransferase [Mesobacterium sp. TK19101]MEC3862754.1 gamma-glutamylcyclotransferase [Mesobacterium sp. TK19101]